MKAVHYPGLSTHPGHSIGRRQAKGFGAIISFVLEDDCREAAERFVQSTRLFRLAESLGGVKSLLSHPATMTHASVPAARRKQAGISDGLIRLSIGLEETEDLINDLEQAFASQTVSVQTLAVVA